LMLCTVRTVNLSPLVPPPLKCCIPIHRVYL
jgi:hypothetical protein